jgi:hypothetical protein
VGFSWELTLPSRLSDNEVQCQALAPNQGRLLFIWLARLVSKTLLKQTELALAFSAKPAPLSWRSWRGVASLPYPSSSSQRPVKLGCSVPRA